MLILIIFLLLEIYLLNRTLKFFILSPVYIYVLFSVTSLVLSVWYFYFFEKKISLFNLDNVSEPIFLSTITLYILALICFLTGFIFYYDLSSKKNKILFNKSFTNHLFLKYNSPKVFDTIAICISLLIVVLFYTTYGNGLFFRNNYLPDTNKFFTIFIKILIFLEMIVLGLIYKNNKILSSTLFIFIILLSISTGSRSVFLFYLFYVCFVFISSGNNLFNKLRFSLHLFIGFIFLAFIMQLRSLDSHGLIPYLSSILNSESRFIDNIYFNLYYSFIYGVFVTIGTLEKAKIDWYIILVNLNPMPGSLAGWYDYADKMRLNIFAPYSLHGRVFKTGYFFTIVYFFSIGVVFSFFEKKVRKLFIDNRRILAFLLLIFLVLHIIYAFEYNMRAAVRYIYYAFIVLLIQYLFKEIKKNLPRVKKNL